MKYMATVHTLEIKPLLPETISSEKWVKWINTQKPDYTRDAYLKGKKSEPRIVINPHKTERLANGLFHFDYDGLTRHREIMQSICRELNMDGYIIRRFDVCLDSDQPYEKTEKLTRLIMLLLGENIGADNRYSSFDPLTFEPKTTRIQNGDKKMRTLELEHYNRAVVDQDQWDTKIINRFELRAMGAQAGKRHDERDIVEKWIERLHSLETADIRGLESTLNAGIFSEWEAYAYIAEPKDASRELNAFLRMNAYRLFTRAQIKFLFRIAGKGDGENATDNLIRRSGKLFKHLFTRTDIKTEVNEMISALTKFVNT